MQQPQRYQGQEYRIFRPNKVATFTHVWDTRDNSMAVPDWERIEPQVPEPIKDLGQLVPTAEERLAAQVLVLYWRQQRYQDVSFHFNNKIRGGNGYPLIDGYLVWYEDGERHMKAIELKSTSRNLNYGFQIFSSEGQKEAVRSSSGYFFIIKKETYPGRSQPARTSHYRTTKVNCYIHTAHQLVPLTEIRQREEEGRQAARAARRAELDRVAHEHGMTGFGSLSKRKR